MDTAATIHYNRVQEGIGHTLSLMVVGKEAGSPEELLLWNVRQGKRPFRRTAKNPLMGKSRRLTSMLDMNNLSMSKE